MARIPRILITGDATAYHVISRTALDGYPMGDVEKDYFIGLLKRFGRLYFTEIMGFCVMGNHFHLLVRMLPETHFSDGDIKKRYAAHYCGEDKKLSDGQIPFWREKLSNLSEFMREIKVGFTRFYNRRHNRRGYFWGDRFKSLIVENGDTLINCLAYIDLNPVRAGLVKRPEDYRWNSIGYHVQAGNKDNLLSLDFGLKGFGRLSDNKRLARYRRFLYKAGAIQTEKGPAVQNQIVEAERKKDFKITATRRFLYKTRYFTDSGIIGTKQYVQTIYQQIKSNFSTKQDKIPNPITAFAGIYSLKRLME